MSYISNTIDELIVKNKMSGAGLARTSGINEAQISRLRTGLKVWVDPEDLVRIACGFSPSPNSDRMPEIHALLLRARLQDECSGPGAKFISIVLTPELGATTPGEVHQEARPVLPPRIQQNLDLIASNITGNLAVRDLIESVANMCRRACVSHAVAE